MRISRNLTWTRAMPGAGKFYSIRNSPSPSGINIPDLHTPRRQLHATRRLHAGPDGPTRRLGGGALLTPRLIVIRGTAAPGRDMPLTTGSLGYGSMPCSIEPASYIWGMALWPVSYIRVFLISGFVLSGFILVLALGIENFGQAGVGFRKPSRILAP